MDAARLGGGPAESHRCLGRRGRVLIAGSGLLAEATYAHLLGIRPSFTPAGVLKSGAQFFITLLTVRGRSLLLLELRPAPRYRFYWPQGSTTWDVDEEEIDKLAGRTRAPLTRLLGGFRSLTQCQVGPEEVTR